MQKSFSRMAIAAVWVLNAFVPMATSAQPAGPVGHWQFNEGSGTTAVDASGNGYDGTAVGPTWNGSALDFDGVDDYVVIPNDIQIGHAITMAAWIKPDNLEGYQDQFGQWQIRRGGILVHRWDNYDSDHIFSTWGSQLHYNVRTDYNWFTVETPVGSLETGKWQHVAVRVVDPGLFQNKQVEIYIDGVVAGSGEYWGEGFYVGNYSWYIGREAWGVADGQAVFSGWPLYFDGQIKDVRLYDRALAPAEVQALAGVKGKKDDDKDKGKKDDDKDKSKKDDDKDKSKKDDDKNKKGTAKAPAKRAKPTAVENATWGEVKNSAP